MSFKIIQGDCLEVLKTLPAESVHCCVTSPPYWGLRDYGTAQWEGGDAECDHLGAPMRTKANINANCGTGTDRKNAEGREFFREACGKCGATRIDKQIGLEKTPELFVAKMVEVFREVRRVLRDDGTLWLNLGDSFCSTDKWGGGKSGNTGKHTVADDGGVPSWTVRQRKEPIAGIKPKDLVGIPWLVAFALRADGWYLRSDIIWHKPNPMPESVTDRPTKSHEYIFLLTKSAKYYYDAEAVKEASTFHPVDWNEDGTPRRDSHVRGDFGGKNTELGKEAFRTISPTRNKRSVWTVATAPFSGAHFATFPPKLIEPCILAGTSEQGCCSECGAPWERVVERVGSYTPVAPTTPKAEARELGAGCYRPNSSETGGVAGLIEAKTVAWIPTCNCNPSRSSFCSPPQPCTVLDPFAGAGTTGLVARRLGRSFIGIELNPAYLEMGTERIVSDAPLFNTVEAGV